MAKTIGRGIGRLICAALITGLVACGSAPVGPGFYRVERGDTVSKIARSNRQSVQNIVRWNNLSNPDSIEVGRVLRIAPPPGTASAGTTSRAGTRDSTPTAPREPATSDASASTAQPQTISLVWPTSGQVIRGFDGRNSKGIDIANTPGTPIVAAAGGTVVYAGSGLRGYGNLLIIKHNADYLTAYAHNRAIFVKEGATVAQGQKIAEMGSTDSDRPMLHFELRYQGRSIDPAARLPAR